MLIIVYQQGRSLCTYMHRYVSNSPDYLCICTVHSRAVHGPFKHSSNHGNNRVLIVLVGVLHTIDSYLFTGIIEGLPMQSFMIHLSLFFWPFSFNLAQPHHYQSGPCAHMRLSFVHVNRICGLRVSTSYGVRGQVSGNGSIIENSLRSIISSYDILYPTCAELKNARKLIGVINPSAMDYLPKEWLQIVNNRLLRHHSSPR